MLRASLKVITPEREIRKQMLRAMHRHVKKYFKNNAKYLETHVASELMTALIASPTMKSLQNGPLREELGVQTPNVWGITMAIVNSSKLTVNVPKITGNNIVGRIRLEAAPTDLAILKTGDPGVEETENGQMLPWLEWLTTLGDAVIVRDYEVRAGFPNHSRTGDKIMVRGKGWRVPPEHAGTQDNNFLTKAIDEALPKLEKDIIYYFKGALGVR
jgi:hypothetical protein